MTTIAFVLAMITIALTAYCFHNHMEGVDLPMTSSLYAIMRKHGFRVKGKYLALNSNEIERAIRLLTRLAKDHPRGSVREAALEMLVLISVRG